MPLYDPQLTLRLALDAVGWKWDRRPLARKLELVLTEARRLSESGQEFG